MGVCNYRIWDDYNEEWHPTSYAFFEDAETAMESLIKDRKDHDLPYDFDIYEKIT